MTLKTFHSLAALVLAVAAGTSFASGQHAGGHGGDAIGKPGVAAKATRTVRIDMTDAMRFTPASIAVKQGETVRFIVKNSGQLKHEMVLGTVQELKEHYEVMKKHPEMEHADDNMVTVAPGQTGEIVWQFTQAGKIDFACLQPGHYDAGMKGAIQVAAKDRHAGHQH
ncbi:MAG TPA: cupredoxin family protein [Roseateles sp.]|uniref:cupredoxin domain-containing protein n=1 Tax=Roseateles sp. TaxID=1971397 RepID=UPI002EDAD719